MAIASASAWSKPGSWALDAESHESEPASVMDFPTLAAAASTKAPKKKKPQTLSLAEFTTGSNKAKPAPARLTHDEMMALPTGPRERSAEELERPRGFGHTSYNSSGSNRNREESGNRRSGSGPERDNGPSRADEVDDWGKGKKSVVPERRGGGGGFFDSNPSRADDANSWVSNKRESGPVQSDSRRSGSSNWGFNNKERDLSSDTWGRKREEVGSGINKERDLSSDTWGRKREELGTGTSSGSRPKLLLQPRTLPLATPPADNGSNGDITPKSENGSGPIVKSKGPSSNPFGAARPREEVLAEKGQDWRELEEKLESAKIREEKPSFTKKTADTGNDTIGTSQDRTEQAWRKPVSAEEVKPVEPTETPRTYILSHILKELWARSVGTSNFTSEPVQSYNSSFQVI